MAISPQQLMIYLYSAHRAVIFAIAQLTCHHCIRFRQKQKPNYLLASLCCTFSHYFIMGHVYYYLCIYPVV